MTTAFILTGCPTEETGKEETPQKTVWKWPADFVIWTASPSYWKLDSDTSYQLRFSSSGYDTISDSVIVDRNDDEGLPIFSTHSLINISGNTYTIGDDDNNDEYTFKAEFSNGKLTISASSFAELKNGLYTKQ